MVKSFTKFLLVVVAALFSWNSAYAADATFDFANNPENWPTSAALFDDDNGVVTELTVNGVKLVSIQNNEFNANLLYKAEGANPVFRIAKTNAFKLIAPEGKALVNVAVTMAAATFDFEASNGVVADNVWTGNASEVTFTTAAIRSIAKIEITLADENSETVKPVTAIEVADIAAFNALEAGKSVKLTLTNARVNGAKGGDYYVEDATGATVVKGLNLTVGTKLNGYVLGTKSIDNSIDFMNEPALAVEHQLTATDATTFEATETTLEGTAMNVEAAQAQANYGKLITLENVTITGGGQNKTLTDGAGKTIKARDYMAVLPADYTWPEKASKITGVVIYYMSGWFLMPISAEAIVAAAEDKVALFDFENNNGNWAVGTSENINAGNLEKAALKQGNVTLTFVSSPTMPTRYYENGARGKQLQLIKDGMMRVTAAEGKAIKTIRFTYNPSVNSSTGVVTYQNNLAVDKGEGTLTNDKLIWTGNATSVRFKATAAVYVDSIEVETIAANAQTVTPAADVYTTEVSTLAAFNELADGTPCKLTLTDAIITSGMVNGWGCYVQDATAGAHFYCTGLDFNVNDIINGYVYVTKNKQMIGSRIAMTEGTNAEHLTVTAGGTVTPVEGTITAINVAANLLKVVKLTDVAVKGTAETTATITDGEGKTIDINNAKTNFYPYVLKDDLSKVNYAKATVVGILFGANGGNKIVPLSITETTTPNGISIVGVDATDVKIYNLQGVRQNKLQKGMNIVNGKKIVIK